MSKRAFAYEPTVKVIDTEFPERIWASLNGETVAYVRERTCEPDGTIHWQWTGPTTYYEHELSCGHVITSTEKEPPKFCEECGARVIGGNE